MSKLSEMTDQELEIAAETSLEGAIKIFGEIERRTCKASQDDPGTYGEVNAFSTQALGYLKLSKASATLSGLAMPGVVLFAGGGK